MRWPVALAVAFAMLVVVGVILVGPALQHSAVRDLGVGAIASITTGDPAQIQTAFRRPVGAAELRELTSLVPPALGSNLSGYCVGESDIAGSDALVEVRSVSDKQFGVLVELSLSDVDGWQVVNVRRASP